MKTNKSNKNSYLLIGAGLVAGGILYALSRRKTIPDGVNAVNNFDKQKYLGKWFEIARFNYRFERTLNNVSAEYSLNKDGSIKVVNKGYNYKTGKYQSVEGKAKFAGDANIAKLKVSFFGPFYAGYNVIALDDDYKYALVAGQSRNYLWLLSREKTMPENVKQQYLAIAANYGFNVANLVWVKQD